MRTTHLNTLRLAGELRESAADVIIETCKAMTTDDYQYVVGCTDNENELAIIRENCDKPDQFGTLFMIDVEDFWSSLLDFVRRQPHITLLNAANPSKVDGYDWHFDIEVN